MRYAEVFPLQQILLVAKHNSMMKHEVEEIKEKKSKFAAPTHHEQLQVLQDSNSVAALALLKRMSTGNICTTTSHG